MLVDKFTFYVVPADAIHHHFTRNDGKNGMYELFVQKKYPHPVIFVEEEFLGKQDEYWIFEKHDEQLNRDVRILVKHLEVVNFL